MKRRCCPACEQTETHHRVNGIAGALRGRNRSPGSPSRASLGPTSGGRPRRSPAARLLPVGRERHRLPASRGPEPYPRPHVRRREAPPPLHTPAAAQAHSLSASAARRQAGALASPGPRRRLRAFPRGGSGRMAPGNRAEALHYRRSPGRAGCAGRLPLRKRRRPGGPRAGPSRCRTGRWTAGGAAKRSIHTVRARRAARRGIVPTLTGASPRVPAGESAGSTDGGKRTRAAHATF